MRRFFAGLVLAIALLGATSACTKVAPGYVGIVVENYGSQRGVQDFPIKTGRVWYNPFTEDVYKFPTYQQNVVWAVNGEDGDRSVTVNSVEGATVNFDVQASVQFVGDSVPKIFVKFRQDDDHILDVYVRSLVRDALSRTASRMQVTEIFGNGKQQLQDSALAIINRELNGQGILITQLSLIGEMRVDDKVKNSINAVLAAAQAAIEAQNKVAQSRAEAEQQVAEARGDSASAMIRASGQAAANAKLQQSLTSAVLEAKRIDKWNGVLPQVTGGGNPFISIKQP